MENDSIEVPPSTNKANEATLSVAEELAARLSVALKAMEAGVEVDTSLIIDLPQRKSSDTHKQQLAQSIAHILFFQEGLNDESMAPIIKYEKEVSRLRAYTSALSEQQASSNLKQWPTRIARMGPWKGQEEEPLSLTGPPAIPMPVAISDHKSLFPFFQHLRNAGRDDIASTDVATEQGLEGEEPFYGTHFLEFPKGVLYADQRMDLCKMVVGPTHIGELMDSLEGNEFTKHFLLGNNIIGPVGARHIADFIRKRPGQMETWYLAGNCIDTASLEIIVDSLEDCSKVTNIWLKRNPLTAAAAPLIFRVIMSCPNMRTLDLDQTELGDKGIAHLFALLAAAAADTKETSRKCALQNLYIDADGVGEKAAASIARYLSLPQCSLQSLFMCNNPLGDTGAILLAEGLRYNTSLLRVIVSSCGIGASGAVALCDALHSHPSIIRLDLGQHFATEDLGVRYNWITEEAIPSISTLVEKSSTLLSLTLGIVPIPCESLNEFLDAVNKSKILLHCTAKTLVPYSRPDIDWRPHYHRHKELQSQVKISLHANAIAYFKDPNLTPQQFQDEEQRFILNPRDVRLIDSVYRNRDAGLARRKLMVLNKFWDEDDETLSMVQSWSTDGVQKGANVDTKGSTTMVEVF